jgi:hypothetical protein
MPRLKIEKSRFIVDWQGQGGETWRKTSIVCTKRSRKRDAGSGEDAGEEVPSGLPYHRLFVCSVKK